MEHETTGAAGSKKVYRKPQIQRVELRPEQAVLGACRNVGVSGPVQVDCLTPAACLTIGS